MIEKERRIDNTIATGIGLLLLVLICLSAYGLLKPTSRPIQVTQPQSTEKAVVWPFEPDEKFTVLNEPPEFMASTSLMRVRVVRERDGKIYRILTTRHLDWPVSPFLSGRPVKIVQIKVELFGAYSTPVEFPAIDYSN